MGAAPSFVIAPGECALIHTGGMLPEGADAVIMLEYTQRVSGEVEILRAVADGENLLRVGEDVTVGQVIIRRGTRLRPAEIGGLMALGITELRVVNKVRVGIISSGDEVIPAERIPSPGQVRDINSYTLAGLVSLAGGHPITYPIVPDRQDALDTAVRQAFDDADVVVITAGSSVSYRDLTAAAINKLGRPGVLVHGVAIRPGKPTILAVCDSKPVFGLPGNPVSCINIFRRFVTPTIRLLLGAPPLPERTVYARLARNIPGGSGRADFVRVRLEHRGGEAWAVPVFGKSNLIFTLVRSDGVVEVPLNSSGIPAGEMVAVRLD